MTIKASISKTYFKEVNGETVFCKLKEDDSFDTRTVMFQNKLSEIIKGKFKINRFISINIKLIDNRVNYELEFEKINELKWEPDHENMRIIGTAMAHIHNYSYYNKNLISLPHKNEEYNSMDKWLYLSKREPDIKDAFEKRLHIFNKIKRFNNVQPKIPLHRDFKIHNILFDGNSYNLIDFDFAAVDYVSIEIMSFIVDVYKYGIEYIKTFLENYHRIIDIPVISKDYTSDYINYLCANTFPYYLSDRLDSTVLKELAEYRDQCLMTIFENKKEIDNLIQESKYDSN